MSFFFGNTHTQTYTHKYNKRFNVYIFLGTKISDSVFSERYMGVPADNYRYYDEADVTKRAGNLKDKMFLLIHGTADDTVHYQQSMLLVKALTKEGVLFRHQVWENLSLSHILGEKDYLLKGTESGFLKDLKK